MKIEMEMDKNLRKKVRKYNSVLKAYRTQGGLGLGMFALGIMLAVIGILLGLPMLLVNPKAGMGFGGVMALIGFLIALPSYMKHKKRVDSYLDFFQESTGYSAAELQAADRELMSPDAVKITCTTDRGRKETVFFITEHYFLSAWPVKGCYLKKLDDVVAAFYSNQIPGINGYRQNLFVISRQDIQKEGIQNEYTKKQYRGFENAILTNKSDCQQICMKVLDEMTKRAPHIITSQNISVKGMRYNLLSMDNWRADWARIFES